MAVRTLDTWRDRAACRGPETALFFPPTHAPSDATSATRASGAPRRSAASARCRRECLEYALGIGEMHGIWGGLNEAERRGLLETNYS